MKKNDYRYFILDVIDGYGEEYSGIVDKIWDSFPEDFFYMIIYD
jgi:hypothetical protein